MDKYFQRKFLFLRIDLNDIKNEKSNTHLGRAGFRVGPCRGYVITEAAVRNCENLITVSKEYQCNNPEYQPCFAYVLPRMNLFHPFVPADFTKPFLM
jgi:hypothetical protein